MKSLSSVTHFYVVLNPIDFHSSSKLKIYVPITPMLQNIHKEIVKEI